MLIFIFIRQCSTYRRMSVRTIARRASNEHLKHFIRTKNKILHVVPKIQLRPRVMSLPESQLLYPSNSHTWLCDGKLLMLLDADNPTNYSMFRVCLIIIIMCTRNMLYACLIITRHYNY